MWKKVLFERECKWTGIEGDRFHTERYIACIYYTHPKFEGKPYLTYGAYGAVVGGSGGNEDWACKHINSCNIDPKGKVTPEMLKEAIEKFKSQIVNDPDKYKWIPEPIPEY